MSAYTLKQSLCLVTCDLSVGGFLCLCIFMHLTGDSALNALYHYMPILHLTEKLADKHGRAMFLSDQPFSLF